MSPTENDFDLRSRVVNLEQQLTGILPRLVVLEKFQVQSEIADARKDEQWKHMDNRFNDLEKKISGVSDTLAKVVWLIISALILGVVSFMIKGGFNVA
ncbi:MULTISPECIES: hypothetical protein [Brucellaceae]|uniref:hypothetical protein n=1 Tax=Brucellaceae TaxID=118882 RepID=UPI000E236F4F|nr:MULTISPECIES: hypothetical protein [Brucellaceae]MBX8785294.1 hypothetical protein [Ochrobactrum sp. GRS2]MBX8813297.1 hypothetical protein [Ochrobactrum sp. MR34]MBX8824765.1 hypothetical protein [Ochrobactrum sp. SFR4]MDP8249295.1 hypothetical protein [Pseudochrobactrum saccharolyticum]MDP8250389.1 hypothetical protein [Pseudochrobactrum saccharolyticum]